MKFRQLSVLLFVLVVSIIVAAPAFAAIGILPPPVFDPCFGATVVATMGTTAVFDSVSGADFNTVVVAYDLSMSGTVVGHVITTYKRIVVGGSLTNVAMDDTFIDVVDNVTVFGRSVNRNQTGLIGLQGVITGAVNFGGSINTAIKGSYITSSITGTDRMCFFLQ